MYENLGYTESIKLFIPSFNLASASFSFISKSVPPTYISALFNASFIRVFALFSLSSFSDALRVLIISMFGVDFELILIYFVICKLSSISDINDISVEFIFTITLFSLSDIFLSSIWLISPPKSLYGVIILIPISLELFFIGCSSTYLLNIKSFLVFGYLNLSLL